MLFATVADSGLLELCCSSGYCIGAILTVLTFWELFFRSLSGFFADGAKFWRERGMSCCGSDIMVRRSTCGAGGLEADDNELGATRQGEENKENFRCGIGLTLADGRRSKPLACKDEAISGLRSETLQGDLSGATAGLRRRLNQRISHPGVYRRDPRLEGGDPTRWDPKRRDQNRDQPEDPR
jgi:hypothetical protein